jgi:hypothetical protein
MVLHCTKVRVSGRTRRRLSVGAVLIAAVTWSCDDPVHSYRLGQGGVNPAYVVGRAADALDAQGQFVLAPRFLGTERELTEGEALRLVSVYMKTYGRSLDQLYTEQHGSAVHSANLTPCGHAYYAETPYESETNASLFVRKFLGPQWLVQMCEDTKPAVMVAVSSLATDLSIAADHVPVQRECDSWVVA